MSTMITEAERDTKRKFDPAIEHLKSDLANIEMNVLTNYTLADAIREGSTVSKQAYDWGYGDTACALSAGCIAAQARFGE